MSHSGVHNASAHTEVCPKCGSDELSRWVYGAVLHPIDPAHDVAGHRLIPGGCCLFDDSPARHCESCSTDFGRVGSNYGWPDTA